MFVPGAGWIGLDPTSGLLAGEGHIPLAATPNPSSAAPITGTLGLCEVEFDFAMSISRIHEDPRVTLPYTPEQWQAINTLGKEVDRRLAQDDVRLTIGGEPIAWDEVWSNGACETMVPPLPIQTGERLALEALAQHFHADWLWYGHAPDEEIAVELQRFIEAQRPVMPVNVKSRRIAGLSDLRASRLDAGQLWIVDLLQNTWARPSLS